MSHRNYEAPRHGHLGFVPRRRARRPGMRGRIRSHPKDKKSDPLHLTAFLGYKAGMTHIVRDVHKPGSKLNKKEVVEPVTIIEAPPMIVVGITGYYQSPFGLKSLGVVWAQHISNDVQRRYYKKWQYSKKNAFTSHIKNFFAKENKRARKKKLQAFAKHAKVIRILAHTQISKLGLGQKKTHLAEIQVNGASVPAKIKYAYSLLEKYVPIDKVFKKNQMIDCMGITKGQGYKGVVSRFGVKQLPRKTHRGYRKVGCIGAWHPAGIQWTVARAGQKGFHHRTHANKKVYMVGKSLATEAGRLAGKTDFDLTEKSVNPIGGFKRYGFVTEDFIMIKGCIPGCPKRVVVMRQGILPTSRDSPAAKEEISLKFIDTSSKQGTGHFQTKEEKRRFLGPNKKEKEAKRQKDLESARQKLQEQA